MNVAIFTLRNTVSIRLSMFVVYYTGSDRSPAWFLEEHRWIETNVYVAQVINARFANPPGSSRGNGINYVNGRDSSWFYQAASTCWGRNGWRAALTRCTPSIINSLPVTELLGPWMLTEPPLARVHIASLLENPTMKKIRNIASSESFCIPHLIFLGTDYLLLLDHFLCNIVFWSLER